MYNNPKSEVYKYSFASRDEPYQPPYQPKAKEQKVEEKKSFEVASIVVPAGPSTLETLSGVIAFDFDVNNPGEYITKIFNVKPDVEGNIDLMEKVIHFNDTYCLKITIVKEIYQKARELKVKNQVMEDLGFPEIYGPALLFLYKFESGENAKQIKIISFPMLAFSIYYNLKAPKKRFFYDEEKEDIIQYRDWLLNTVFATQEAIELKAIGERVYDLDRKARRAAEKRSYKEVEDEDVDYEMPE